MTVKRRAALDLPHPREQGRSGRPFDRAAEKSAGHPRLVTDMREFFDKWARAKGQFQGSRHRIEDLHGQAGSSATVQATRASNASAAAVCYSACDVVAWNPDYLGPAALNRAGRW
jgi:succinate dehydrogenase/fumarate reductase-like Fe-S protein